MSRINKDVEAALASPDIKDHMAKLGNAIVYMTPAQFSRFVRSEMNDHGRMLKTAGVKPQRSAAAREWGEQLNRSEGRPRIVVSNAGKGFGALEVFRSVSLEVGECEVLAIIGPSGCGKTTLLRCMNGLLPLSEGEVRIEGETVSSPPEGVAMVFQHFGLFPWKTVFQNVAYGLRLAGASRAEIEEKLPRFIKLVGLTGFEGYYPYQISGGMQQRCGLARALSIEPRVLLMDEPFAAVDAQTREILQLELLRIWEQSRTTMVFVTHAIDEAVLMGDRVLVLKGRPSAVHEIVEVDLPRPRDRATLLLPRFAELREHVWSTLMADARQAEFEVKT